MVFQYSLSDSKSPRLTRSFRSILADFSCVVVWMVSIIPLIESLLSLSFSVSKELFQEFQLQLVSPHVPRFFFNFSSEAFNSVAKSWYLTMLHFSLIFTLVC